MYTAEGFGKTGLTSHEGPVTFLNANLLFVCNYLLVNFVGGGAQPLTFYSILNLARWILEKYTAKEFMIDNETRQLRILWVGIGFGEEAIVLSTFFRHIGVQFHIFAMELM
jgi:hypothetical protein